MIIETAIFSLFTLFTADLAAKVADATIARRKAEAAQELPDVCIPDEEIMDSCWSSDAWAIDALIEEVEALEIEELEAPELEVPEAAPKAARAPRKDGSTRAPRRQAPAIAAPKAPKGPTVKELKAMAQTLGIKTSGLKKAELIRAIQTA